MFIFNLLLVLINFSHNSPRLIKHAYKALCRHRVKWMHLKSNNFVSGKEFDAFGDTYDREMWLFCDVTTNSSITFQLKHIYLRHDVMKVFLLDIPIRRIIQFIMNCHEILGLFIIRKLSTWNNYMMHRFPFKNNKWR